MKHKVPLIVGSTLIIGAIFTIVIVVVVVYLRHQNIAVLNPAGTIAAQERNLMFFALALSLIVVVPVFSMAIIFAWRYRESNTKATYRPDWDRNIIAESIWWGIPTLLILILSVVAWRSSHTLDPYKPIASDKPALTIQVIALDWKWLFIYPKQRIATVNFVQFPNATPINFQITADAPMNSFWIPQLGGQIYAMPGMTTELHLMADKYGVFNGSSANISGSGFSGMHFIAQSNSDTQFNQWVQSIRQSPIQLTNQTYEKLEKQSANNPITYYSLNSTNLFSSVINKYMVPDQPSMLSQNQGMAM